MKIRHLLLTCSSLVALSAVPLAQAGDVSVEVLDKAFDPAGGMLAYTEFELSGEPLAESLGLDLDVLDPNLVNQPTRFDYTAGIESYEYSEEAMYAVNYQSAMGPHLVNGPVNAGRGGGMENLGKRFVDLSASVGFPAEEIPLNMYPITFPYAGGLPEFAQPVDQTVVSSDEAEVLTATGAELNLELDIPAYFRDFKTLSWTKAGMDKSFVPAAVGGQMLKDVMWSQDFLGGMHVTESDEEVEASASDMDKDGVHALGVSAADGLNGVFLTEITWDKLLALQTRFGFDGEKLGVAILPGYDANSAPVWFPHKVAITETQENGVNAIETLEVTDGRSTLRDTWMLLWPVSEFYAFSDQRAANTGQNPAFLAVFDNAPFPAAPAENLDLDRANDRVANDPHSLVGNIANLLFQNLAKLHFNAEAGTFVDDYDGNPGRKVTAYDAAYTLVALSIYQRTQDALPVGYATADAGDNLDTKQGREALDLLRRQADFIIEKLVGKDGLVVDAYDLDAGPSANTSLDSQFAAIRGLTTAFQATGDARFKEAARNIYIATEKLKFDNAVGTFADQPGQPTVHTPWTAAAISSGLRSLMLSLKNEEGESEPLLELAHLAERYESWFKTVINGPSTGEGMQLSEWLGDSGENVIHGKSVADSDEDNVPKITAAGGEHGTAMTMAAKVKVH